MAGGCVFFVPAGLAILCSIFLFVWLRDTPPSLVCRRWKAPGRVRARRSFSSELFKQVFGNKYVWLLSLGSFCVYTVRYAVLDWGPTLLTEMKHVELTHSGWMVAGFEVVGRGGHVASGAG